ncbi:MAG: protein kinase, partial [Planctomycetes bacterium]|nr:protein kinase [Planctomycetota bacterium]
DRFKECQDKGLPAIPTGELVTFFGQAAEALDYLQSQHVSHRDIKPQNLLSLQGFAKVADFGLARGQDEKLEEASVVCGTPYYMAPEVWMQQISSQSDQYGLAATYAHMRIGKPLFTGTFHEIFMHHIGSVPDLDSLPPAERAVLLQALDKKPDQRFPSCVAFAQALKEATTPIGAVVVPDRRRFLKIAAIPAILALATAGYLIANKGSKDDKPSNPAPPPEPKVSWQPKGWEPENEDDIVTDRNTRRFYRRLVRDVGGQKVTMVVVPRTGSTDPKTFYMMENKVWNDLYAVFAASEQSGILFKRYSSPQVGLEKMVSGEQLWRRGALSESHPDPEMAPYFGVEGAKGRLPVFRITVTEAHCFAEWMDGRLPRRKQWLKAAGQGEDTRVGPFTGAATDTNGLAINLRNGPWPVEQGNRDVSIHGCRQMATNGEEWTRDLQGETTVIPLDRKLSSQRVHLLSQSYLSAEPLTFEAMAIPRLKDCTENSVEVTFRVVLEE